MARMQPSKHLLFCLAQSQDGLAMFLVSSSSCGMFWPPGMKWSSALLGKQGADMYGNLALQGQPAIQSSTTSNLVATLAVSGGNGTGAGQCSQTQDGSSAAPAWWMVDLGVSTAIEGLIVTSGLTVSDLQISIGDQDSPVTNTPCSQGQQIANNTAVAQICQGRGRYVSLTRASGNTVSLCRVEVFPTAADAASGKNVTVSGGINATAATDGDPTTCAAATPSGTSAGAWITVDLGYTANIATVGIALGTADLLQGVTNLRAGLQVSHPPAVLCCDGSMA